MSKSRTMKIIDDGLSLKVQMIPIVKWIKLHPDAQIPKYTTEGAAGMDLHICERVDIMPGERKLVTTGLRIKIPVGFEGQVRPRSGLAAKQGITVLNTPGTIDSDYTGELKIILYNSSNETVTFMCPDRIAQLVISPVVQAANQEVIDFEETTERDTKGFGSTGV